MPQILLQEPTIVLRGNFNPAIFQPAWFAARQLLRDDEVEAANVGLVMRDIGAQFNAGWLGLFVTRDRFQARTSDLANELALRDLVHGTFGLLDQTPLSVLGVNRLVHFKLDHEGDWDRVAQTIAPIAPWQGLLGAPHMLGVGHSSTRTDGLAGNLTVHVHTSEEVKPLGLVVNVNHHLELSGSKSNEQALGILQKDWTRLQGDALDLAKNIIEKCLGGNV